MIPTKIIHLLTVHINDCFEQAEHQHDITIPAADKEFLINIVPKLLDAHITKFVTGAVEHHDSPFLSMSPDQMIEEALKESTDLPNYLHGYFYLKAARNKNV